MIVVEYQPDYGDQPPGYPEGKDTISFNAPEDFYRWMGKTVCECCTHSYIDEPYETVGEIILDTGWGAENKIVEGDDLLDYDTKFGPYAK